MDEGFFDLDSPADLLAKLGRELDRMREHPHDADHAFNFFVTAEHLLDWIYPRDEPARRTLRDRSPLLSTVWDLASGAKHFWCHGYHGSVKRSQVILREANTWNRKTVAGAASWSPRKTALPPFLVVNLDGKAADEFGDSIGALELAEKVVAYWRESPLVQPGNE